uniref:HECT-type E3 ubiquitin transferase n=1 Tax=Echinostoma caproni TaxID=27848 RepID=A0A183B4E9_9TREM
LATLDRELYKSLSYIKHYDGDVADLEFTYSYAEDCLGQVVVHDLCPGGRYITVTNDLKISYVHRVAHFRMYKQIRAQTASFIRGFYSILNPDWLAMFSPPELQKLISGDSISVNIDDLKQNTRYSGGFHSNHRVIKWLWDILRRDFSDEERSLFLKV